MTPRLLLPIAAVSLFALAACENRTQAPEQPDPDAGMPVSSEVQNEAEIDDAEVMSPAELQQRREEIEQDAQETFESIMDQTQRTGDELVQFGDSAMQSLSESISSAADTVESQFDAASQAVAPQIEAASETIDTQIDRLVGQVEEVRDDNLTDAQKREIVINTRNAAEDAARGLGYSSDEVRRAGDMAEARVRAVLDI